MTTKDDLIRENRELRSKLNFAKKWMAREVASSLWKIREGALKKSQRKHFENAFESEKIDLITKKIFNTYGNLLERAPKYTLERLIDAEIYWETLQRYPHTDGLPIVLSYQKILDDWIEERFIAPWRTYCLSEKKRLRGIIEKTDLYSSVSETTGYGLEKDLENIIKKHYRLSIGRFYQILFLMRQNMIILPLLNHFIDFLRSREGMLVDMLVSDAFFLPFSELIELEIFSKKRHEKKVTFSDIKTIKKRIGDLLHLIFSLNFED